MSEISRVVKNGGTVNWERASELVPSGGVACGKEWESLDGKLDGYKVRMGGLKNSVTAG
jgi:hypothetical protein